MERILEILELLELLTEVIPPIEGTAHSITLYDGSLRLQIARGAWSQTFLLEKGDHSKSAQQLADEIVKMYSDGNTEVIDGDF